MAFRKLVIAALVPLVFLVAAVGASAQMTPHFSENILRAIQFRNVSPYRIGARIAAIAVPASPREAHLNTIYVAGWDGGIFKTNNRGTTWKPIFDNVGARDSIGAISIAPSNSNIVWAGTGDAFESRSSYAGDGVYKSTDAGKTWAYMGLSDTQHIARIVIDPKNSDIVYVAATGHLYTPNKERGVFKTTDGGKTWKKVLYLSDKVGAVDLVMDPMDPSVLYAATYDVQRLPWKLINGGPKSGIYKSTDAGAHWKKLTNGLPTGRIGRIGLALYPKNPKIVYALIENANPCPRADLAKCTDRTPAEAGPELKIEQSHYPEIGGEVFRTMNAGVSWVQVSPKWLNISGKGPYYFNQIFVDPDNYKHIYTTGASLGSSMDGGHTWRGVIHTSKPLFSHSFGDERTLWIDQEDPDHILIGNDGGLFVSYDGGQTADHFPNLPLQQFYEVAVDNDQPFNVYGGIQDHDNWKGVSNGPNGLVDSFDWTDIGNGDGIFAVPDSTNSRWVYTTQPYGGQGRIDQKLGIRTDITPIRGEKGKPPYRYIWNTPIAISPHDGRVIYTGGQMLLKSNDRGDHWHAISPDLSTHPPASEILNDDEGGISGGIPWFAISSITVSPVTRGLIWVGTSDGKLWVTRDGGTHWTDLTKPLARAGANPRALVSNIVASTFNAGTAFVAKSGYKLDDFQPYIYETKDYGRTWVSIAGNLPKESINAIVQDPVNPKLLCAGTDGGLFVTIDGGLSWVRVMDVPNVVVHSLALQTRAKALVVGTFGRGLYIADISPLEGLSDKTLSANVYLFDIQPTVQRVPWQFGGDGFLFGNRHITTPNAPNGVRIFYYLKNAVSGDASVTVTNSHGQQLAHLAGPASAGIHMVLWKMRRPGNHSSYRGGFAQNASKPVAKLVPLGTYKVTLKVDGRTIAREARITGTQGWSIPPHPQVIRQSSVTQ